jgi:hypothetical protein
VNKQRRAFETASAEIGERLIGLVSFQFVVVVLSHRQWG